MKLSELINKLQHEQVHAQARGEDPDVFVLSKPPGHSGLVEEVGIPADSRVRPGVWLVSEGRLP